MTEKIGVFLSNRSVRLIFASLDCVPVKRVHAWGSSHAQGPSSRA
jgi:hypothetical protein